MLTVIIRRFFPTASQATAQTENFAYLAQFRLRGCFLSVKKIALDLKWGKNYYSHRLASSTGAKKVSVGGIVLDFLYFYS
jgi:hypothetical protein